MQLWYALNPFGDREKIEGRVLYVFLKLAYDPYWDGQQESLYELIEAAAAFFEDVKALQRQHEIGLETAADEEEEDLADPDDSMNRIHRPRACEIREQIDGLWTPEELIQEMF